MAMLVGDTMLVSIIKVGVTNYSPHAKPAWLLDPAAVPHAACGRFHCAALGIAEKWPQSLQHLLSGPSQEKVADP